MMILRWHRNRVVRLGIVAGCVIGGILVLHNMFYIIQDFQCSEEESVKLIADLCQQYNDHEVHGSLCNALCSTKAIQYQKCTNYRDGKKVLLVECHGVCQLGETVQAVLKSKLKEKSENYDLDLPRHKNGSITKDGLDIAKVMFENRAVSEGHLQQTSGQSLFTELWSMSFEEFVRNSHDAGADFMALKNIWSLINQDEYLFIIANQHLSYIPKLYGTCGSFYAIEFAPPKDISSPSWFRQSSVSWAKRSKNAVKFLDLAHSFDVDFQEPVHMCDVKEENFGIGSDNKLKIIDLDSLFYHDAMMKALADPGCTRHEDCDFFDCRGWCNSSKCVPQRTNNNVQSLCEDIFINKAYNFYAGLLRHPPKEISQDLIILLDQCSYPNGNKGEIVRQHVSSETFWKLHALLSRHTQG